MIAMALTNDPKLLIADEPTTALDVTTQAQILRLIERLQAELGMAVIMITHDLGVIAEVADRVMVMYAGEVVESGTLDQIFYDPQHPYTWGLLGSLTRVDQPRLARLAQIAGQPPSLINPPSGCHFRNRCPHEFAKCTEHPGLEKRGRGRRPRRPLLAARRQEEGPARRRDRRDRPRGPDEGADGANTLETSTAPAGEEVGAEDPILVVDHLVKHFPIKSGILIDRQIGAVQAVDDVSFAVNRGETLGLVGESGCGKSTLARSILQLIPPTSGSVKFEGREIAGIGRRQARELRSDMQMVFQDPYASLNPRKRIAQIVGDPMRLHGIVERDGVKEAVQELLEKVGLNPEHYNRFPHEFSGGQRQRIGIARALSLNPKLIIADEPVSALDVSIQAQIINLLEDLQDDFQLTYLFVAHDLSVVRHVADRIAVMYLGKIVEIGPAEEVYNQPDPPLHAGAALGRPDPRSARQRRPQADRPRGRRPESGQPAVRLPLPHALPARHRHLLGRRAAADRPRRQALRSLPPPLGQGLTDREAPGSASSSGPRPTVAAGRRRASTGRRAGASR